MSGSDFRLLYIFFIVLFLLLIFGIRYLKNKENMALIERGMTPSTTNKFNFNALLVLSFIFFGLGLGLLSGHIASKSFMQDSPVIAHFIFVALFLGAGLISAYFIQENKLNK